MIVTPAYELNYLKHESHESYHARSRSGECMSSHKLSDFRKSPLLYKRTIDGLIPEKDSTAYTVGRAAHTLILEGPDEYAQSYQVGGPVNPKTGKEYGRTTKKFLEFEAEQGVPVITTEEDQLNRTMLASVEQHEVAREMLFRGTPEAVVRVEMRGVLCQIRMDWFHVGVGIVDLKTCDDLDRFEYEATRKWDYINQAAFYRSALEAASGHRFPFTFIATEKKEPFRTGVFEATNDSLHYAERENGAALSEYVKCIETNIWPTRYESVRSL